MYKFTKNELSDFKTANTLEWYMPNGLGGYVSSTAINSSFRKHNGYLIASLNSPVNRVMILNKINERLEFNDKIIDLEAQQYDSYIKEGNKYLESFEYNYIPTFTYNIDGIKLIKKLAPLYNKNAVAITYVIDSPIDFDLFLTPLFNNKDHGSIDTKSSLNFKIINKVNDFSLKSDLGFTIHFEYENAEIIDRNDKYSINRYCEFDISTGDDRLDTSFNPIDLKYHINKNKTVTISIVCSLSKIKNDAFKYINDYVTHQNNLIKKAKLNDDFANDLVIASDLFISKRNSTGLKTILAGLPWFTDWGRDTMIAFTGLTLVTKRFNDAKEILLSFSKYERNGLIPNMFPDDNNKPLYNTADASLWYFYACYKYIQYTNDYDFIIENIYPILINIYKAYSTKTDFSIYSDSDYLIHAGSDLDQITWMDVRFDDYVVTPRHGKPVEINALWYNALKILSLIARHNNDDFMEYEELADKVKKSFNKKFYNEKDECLYDVVDPNDSSIRPNQIWAISLPFKILDKEKAKKVVKKVKDELYNIYGLRSLSYKDSRFISKYEGNLRNRDLSYHMGTTWVFPIGGFFDAYAYVNDYSKESIKEIKDMIFKFKNHMNSYCINGIAEIMDGIDPYVSRGCCCQAWSVAEVLRSYYEIVIKQ